VENEEPHHRLAIASARDVSRQSVQYLVDFLSGEQGNAHRITELNLEYCSLIQPSDGGLDIFRGWFANGNNNARTLPKIQLLYDCNFGSVERSLAAL
jgi:hypothetical protein